jgi:L-lactate utilization protein LutC
MSARQNILNRIRAAVEPEVQHEYESFEFNVEQLPDEVQRYLTSPKVQTQVLLAAQSTLANEVSHEVISELIERMESVNMSVARLQSNAEIVSAVNVYLKEQGITGNVSVSPSLQALEWDASVSFGPATAHESASVTSCFAAIAETGSVVTMSGPDTPATLNFLPDTHIVVLYESQVVNYMEDAWAKMRQLNAIPRALNLITGPSRTADIEQQIELGAHGPRSMHVLLVAKE